MIVIRTTRTRLAVIVLLVLAGVGYVLSQATGFVVAALSVGPENAFAAEPALQRDLLTEVEALRLSNAALQAEAGEQERRFADVLATQRDQVRRFSTLAGLTLGETEAPVAGAGDTTEDVAAEGTGGRGGPPLGRMWLTQVKLARLSPHLAAAESHVAALGTLGQQMADVNSRFASRHRLLRRTPLICSILGPWRATDGFGPRRHPVTGEWGDHPGLDMAAPASTPVAAPADGMVRFAGPQAGYGLLVILDHGDASMPRFTTRFGHLSVITVSGGDPVRRGDKIGEVGSTGQSTGAHLHYEIRLAGDPLDPAEFILDP